MEPEAAAADQVARVDPEVDRIEGLITVTAHGGSLLALVASRSELPTVRRELIDLGVPDEMLELKVIEEVMIPYPVTDERLSRWLGEAEESGAVDATVTVKGPRLSITPRGIGKVVLFLIVGYWVLSLLMFILLMVWDRWVA